MAATIDNLSNFRRNKLGGIDADKTVNGEAMPYTLTAEESAIVAPSNIAPYDLSPTKNAALAEINRQRDSLIHGGIEFNGHTFQTDPQSILDVMGAVLAQVPVDWLTADNQTVAMSLTDMVSLGQAIAARKASLVHQARAHKDNVLALTSVSDIDNYMTTIIWS